MMDLMISAVIGLLLLGLLRIDGQYYYGHNFRPAIMDRPRAPPVIYSEFNRTYSDSISSSNAVMFSYRQMTEAGAVKVQVWSNSAKVETPILVVIKRHSSVLSWQVPLLLGEQYTYSVTNRTLCPTKNHFVPNDTRRPIPIVENFFIEVLTLSDRPIDFSLRVETYPAFNKNGDTSFLMEVSPSAPQYVQYNIRPDSSRVLVTLEAIEGASFCGYLSVQLVRCPVGDLESELRLDGRFQTITSKGAIEVHKSQLKENSFYIVVLVQPNDQDCQSPKSGLLGAFRPSTLSQWASAETSAENSSRIKIVRITVTDTVSSKTVVVAVLVPMLVYFAFFVISIVLLQTGCRAWWAILCGNLDDIELPTHESRWRLNRFWDRTYKGEVLPCEWDASCYASSRYSSRATNGIHPSSPTRNGNIELEVLPFTSSNARRIDTEIAVQEGGSGRPVTRVASVNTGRVPAIQDPRRGTLIRMSSINKVPSEKLSRTANEYSFTLITLFIFYSLPALQLVMTHQGLLLFTGNEDLCFYNFSCANRLFIFSDFNHIVSNGGYIILGILFTLQVRRRAVLTARLRLNVPDVDDYGIPSQFGLFYGMGLALIMEGLMSSFYHICPGYNNFQFDTSFMYLISGLLILKMYHSRHPDILPRSYIAYSTFAGFIFIAVLGVMLKTNWYWIGFSIVHGLLTIIIGLQLLFEGYTHASWGIQS